MIKKTFFLGALVGLCSLIIMSCESTDFQHEKPDNLALLLVEDESFIAFQKAKLAIKDAIFT